MYRQTCVFIAVPFVPVSTTLSITGIQSLVYMQPQPVHNPVPSLYRSLRAIKYLPTKIRGKNQTSCHLNNKRLHPAFNKPQIPKSIWIKVFDYQFPSNPRPWPSVASADRRVGLCSSQQGGIPPRFTSLKLKQRSFFTPKGKERTQKDWICNNYVRTSQRLFSRVRYVQ